ncbi:hypothetical protein [Microcoleus vaginatus]|uniref:hypothetical protein n=1 Tax=Microcoleus vaginatus TaxID=119532 RepID=UPI001F611E7E|nr:hypothetical protein D0A37_11970 [Microcoleus vaginatus HSN003]
MPVPQEMNFIVEQASCRLRENGATSQFKLTSCTNISNGLEARSTKNKLDCGTGILPVLKKSAKYWFELID